MKNLLLIMMVLAVLVSSCGMESRDSRIARAMEVDSLALVETAKEQRIKDLELLKKLIQHNRKTIEVNGVPSYVEVRYDDEIIERFESETRIHPEHLSGFVSETYSCVGLISKTTISVYFNTEFFRSFTVDKLEFGYNQYYRNSDEVIDWTSHKYYPELHTAEYLNERIKWYTSPNNILYGGDSKAQYVKRAVDILKKLQLI